MFWDLIPTLDPLPPLFTQQMLFGWDWDRLAETALCGESLVPASPPVNSGGSKLQGVCLGWLDRGSGRAEWEGHLKLRRLLEQAGLKEGIHSPEKSRLEPGLGGVCLQGGLGAGRGQRPHFLDAALRPLAP